MAHTHPDIPFERFADDILCHCVSEAQARRLQRVRKLAQRFRDVSGWSCIRRRPRWSAAGMTTDAGTRSTTFDVFWAIRFGPAVEESLAYFVNFSPAVSNAAAKRYAPGDSGLATSGGVDKRIWTTFFASDVQSGPIMAGGR